jgi:EAL domain-containing protein (putative c-di-GMP-specific phosphodiesterase class I)
VAGHSRSGRRASRGLIIPIGRWVLGQSFVRQISSEEVDATIVTVMISMARSLRLRVVAEGIETAEQLSFLRDHECDQGQGFYFSRPVPADAFAALLANGISNPSRAKIPLSIAS